MDCYYKLRHLFYYKVRHGLLQIATGITKCDDYYKLRQYKRGLSANRPSINWALQDMFVSGYMLYLIEQPEVHFVFNQNKTLATLPCEKRRLS